MSSVHMPLNQRRRLVAFSATGICLSIMSLFFLNWVAAIPGIVACSLVICCCCCAEPFGPRRLIASSVLHFIVLSIYVITIFVILIRHALPGGELDQGFLQHVEKGEPDQHYADSDPMLHGSGRHAVVAAFGQHTIGTAAGIFAHRNGTGGDSDDLDENESMTEYGPRPPGYRRPVPRWVRNTAIVVTVVLHVLYALFHLYSGILTLRLGRFLMAMRPYDTGFGPDVPVYLGPQSAATINPAGGVAVRNFGGLAQPQPGYSRLDEESGGGTDMYTTGGIPIALGTPVGLAHGGTVGGWVADESAGKGGAGGRQE